MDSNIQDWPPASGQELIPAIDQALRVLDAKVQVKFGANDRWIEYSKLWRDFLRLSKPTDGGGIVKLMVKGDLAAVVGVNLDLRYWNGFIGWFERNMLKALLVESQSTGTPAIKPIRWSDRRGGYSDRSEAIYYLVFQKRQPTEQRLDVSVSPLLTDMLWREMPSHIIGRLKIRLLGRWASFSGTKVMDAKSFGFGMVLLAVLLLELCVFLPDDERRMMFVVFGLITALVGFWSIGRKVSSTLPPTSRK